MLQFTPILLALLFPRSQVATQPQPENIPVLTIAVDQPAYTGQPLWIRAVSGPLQNIRYPFHAAAGDIGCNRLEVKRDGVLLAPLPIHAALSMDGIVCGSGAPVGSPEHRLPIHVLYPLNIAGTYSVRWTVTGYTPTGLKPVAQSDWLTFEVLRATPVQHESWIRNLLANPPENDGYLAGDFLPSLLASAPDPRALVTFVKYLHADNSMVSGIAASALEEFPQPEVVRAVAESIEKHGPSEQLAYYATFHKGWTRDDQDKIVRAMVPYLQPANAVLVSKKTTGPSRPTQTSSAIKLLQFIFYIPNHTWPTNPELAAYADAEVMKGAPTIIANGNETTVQQLAEYLGTMQPSLRAHEFLIQIAQRSDTAAEQARICLTWHPQPADLPNLVAVLTTPGDADPRGTDRSSLPYSLVRAYGDDALPYLERAVATSPYVWVRAQSAQQLALRNRPIGFQFLLDAIEADQFYKAEMVRWVKDYFPSGAPRDASDQQVAAFLRSKIGPTSTGRP
jgi:hypothetical protein